MTKTLVIGELNVDMIVSGMTQFPELNHEILCKDIQIMMGSSASIFACRLSQLGGNVDFFGKLGNDMNGRIVLNSLKRSNVGLKKINIDDNLKTGITIVLTYPENKANITYLGCIDSLTIMDINPELFTGYDHIHISSIYLQRKLLSSIAEILAKAKERKIVTSLDPQTDPLNKYEYIDDILDYVDILLLNEKEAQGITGITYTSALEKLSLNIPTIVIKRGEDGAIGKNKNKIIAIDGKKIQPLDTTGAGDSFDAGFIYSFLHKGEDFESSMNFANELAAMSCLYFGGAEKWINEADVLNF